MSRRVATVLIVSLLLAACSSSGGDDRITRIDGPAVVNEEEGG
jgi:hypothetical protein